MNSEKDVKARVKKRLQEMGAWYFMPAMNGFGRAGVPDFIGCHEGHFFAIETKFGKRTTRGRGYHTHDDPRLTAKQRQEAHDIPARGGRWLLVDELNVEDWSLEK